VTIQKLAITLLSLAFFCVSCSSYKQNIMFSVPKNAKIMEEVKRAEYNYTIQKNDLLQLQVYTNKGEKIVDDGSSNQPGVASTDKITEQTYLVNDSGYVKFPLIHQVQIEGLTLRQAEEILEKEFNTYYTDPFVVLTYANKRVVVLGAVGGQVIPLTTENIRLAEVLALAKGIGTDGKAWNIRVLRGDDVYVADLSTIDGYRKNNIIIEPNDIVYVEPVRRPFLESVRDYGSLLSVFTSLATIILIVSTTNSN
jgi:polysaccharide biosynthesis/export protein